MTGINPEFRRQLWLHWRPAQILWIVLFVLLIAAVVATLSDDGKRMLMLWNVSIGAAVLVPLFFGVSIAGRSLQEELQENTWDWQRLSALTPWQMAWGKWLGSTVMAWVVTAICLALALVAAVLSQAKSDVLLGLTGQIASLIVIWGLALQAFGLASAPNEPGTGRRRPFQNAGLRAAALLMIAWMLLLQLRVHGWQSPRSTMWRWWNLDIHVYPLALLFGLVLLLLSALGLWRSMCMRLDMPVLPWGLPLGSAAAAFMLAGLAPQPNASLWAMLAVSLALACALYACLAQRITAFVRWRQCHTRLGQGQVVAALQVVPMWLVSWVFAAALLPLTWLLAAGDAGAVKWREAMCILSLVLVYALRECAFLSLYAMRMQPGRKSDPAIIFSWISLTALLPLLLFGLGQRSLAGLLQPLALVFVERGAATLGVLHWLLLLFEIALLAWLNWQAYRQRVTQARTEAPASAQSKG